LRSAERRRTTPGDAVRLLDDDGEQLRLLARLAQAGLDQRRVAEERRPAGC
jgi:hypothetical protein